jgi:hypothetical protein
MYATASDVIELAKAVNDVAEFADVAEALSALGPEMAIAGGLITLVGDLFDLGGGPSLAT